MNRETALKIIALYLEDKVEATQYEEALEILSKDSAMQERLPKIKNQLKSLYNSDTIDCERFNELMLDILSGVKLSLEKVALFENHLKTCLNCKQVYFGLIEQEQSDLSSSD